jgi:hypothetical protein
MLLPYDLAARIAALAASVCRMRTIWTVVPLGRFSNLPTLFANKRITSGAKLLS